MATGDTPGLLLIILAFFLPAVNVVHLVQFPDHFDRPIGREELVAVLVIETIGFDLAGSIRKSRWNKWSGVARVERAVGQKGKTRATQERARAPDP